MKVTRSVSFDTVQDRRLLAEGEKLPRGKFSETVRTALSAYFDIGSGVSLGMVYARLASIERKLENGAIVQAVERGADDDGDALDVDILRAFD